MFDLEVADGREVLKEHVNNTSAPYMYTLPETESSLVGVVSSHTCTKADHEGAKHVHWAVKGLAERFKRVRGG